MKPLFDTSAPRKPTNLTVNSDLLMKSRALNINLSAVLEKALSQQLAEHAGKQWVDQNRKAIKAYNQVIEANGCFGDDYREF
jgi:antitoxin CcdA